MLRGRLDRRRITVEERLGELPLVAGSPAQLNQVFLNLLVNAMQAIESTHRDDGRIAITTDGRDGEVIVEVADNGCGIADENLPQIFDPFFTTKDVGDGTGLGLSITHSMVQDHGGRLEVESVSGQGTRFRVLLPVARSEVANSPVTRPACRGYPESAELHKGDGDGAAYGQARRGRHGKTERPIGCRLRMGDSGAGDRLGQRRGQEARPDARRGRGCKPLARHVPLRDLLLYLEFSGLDAHADAWRNSAACKLLNDTKLGALLEDLVLQGIELAQDTVPRENAPAAPTSSACSKILPAMDSSWEYRQRAREDWRVVAVVAPWRPAGGQAAARNRRCRRTARDGEETRRIHP